MRSTSPFISNTPETETRVVSTTTTGFTDPTIHESIVWQGSDIDELSRAFPPSDIFGADPLGHSEIEDGFIRTTHRFERLKDGSWEEIDDPRRRLTPVTDLEREIDAENRRLYPGDYITADCDRCGDYGCDECEDPYSYYCDSCQDYGCQKCNPYACEDCRDYGCSSCEPEKYCTNCSDYLDSDSENGLCTQCIDDLSPHCRDCGTKLSETESDLCTPCWAYLCAEHCNMCGQTLGNEEKDTCTQCTEYEQECENRYKMYKEWWINPADGRLKRTISWLNWTLYRVRHIKR